MDIKYLTNAAFDVWGETGTTNRFLRFRHPDLPNPVVLLLSESQIQELCQTLQASLPKTAYSKTQNIQ